MLRIGYDKQTLPRRSRKKWRSYEDSVAKKQIEPDNRELTICLCNRREVLLL